MELIIGNTYTLKTAQWAENQGRQVVLLRLRNELGRITAYIRAVSGPPLQSSEGDEVCTTNAVNLGLAKNKCCCCCNCCNC